GQPAATSNGTPEQPKVTKRAPTVKPKTWCKLGVPRAEEAEQQVAPPLPEKQSRRLQQANVEQAKTPDGKEVELQMPGGEEAEAGHHGDRPLTPACSPGCGCVCHLHRPGMKLVWVPVGAPSGGGERGEVDRVDGVELGEEEEEEGDEEEDLAVALEVVEEEEGEEEEGCQSEEEEEEGKGDERMRKTLFHHTLNA
ncbi:hypothetical protein CRUP_013484, partial [Coryphaenoides rupestris]